MSSEVDDAIAGEDAFLVATVSWVWAEDAL